MNNLDKQYQLKKFLKLIYRDIEEGEHIRLYQNNTHKGETGYQDINYFNDVDDVVSFVDNKHRYLNTYFQLATTNGENGKADNLLYRYCLGFDFDKKDLGEDFNHKDVLNLFKSAKLHYHALIDTGNGYHVYVCINRTNDLDKVNEVQKALCEKLGADINAIKPTQLLRVPYTYNIKGSKKKLVKIVYMEDRHDITPYDIDFLYAKNCNNSVENNSSDTNIKWTINNTNIPKCIEAILLNGSIEGNREADLQKIVVSLRQRNKSLSEIQHICKEWADKSNFNDNLAYRVDWIYNNLSYVSMNCKDCQYRNDCYNMVVSDFKFDDDYDIFILENKLNKQLKNSNRKGAKTMNGNELLIVNVLKNNIDGLYKSEIVRKITYKKKCRLSNKTLIETLTSLEDKGIISVIKANRKLGVESFYTINPIRAKEEEKVMVSYLATSMCICRLITPTELQLYHYMRYLHNKEQQENPKALKGNLFQINQKDLAKAFYGNDKSDSQSNISKMINNLLECHILDIWERNPSKNNGFEYYIYKLNS